MKRETCESQIGNIQSFLERRGIDSELMQFKFLEKANRVYFVVFADPMLSRAGFVSCDQDPWKMQPILS